MEAESVEPSAQALPAGLATELRRLLAQALVDDYLAGSQRLRDVYSGRAGVIYTLTEPALGPIRRALPAMGGLDFSPMVLLFGLQLLRGVLF